ncbi:MAG: hypothetical protein KA163_07705 [Bacteroidia bacterium]|nr:hypothetical protein [Bacteroidia bacterium]
MAGLLFLFTLFSFFKACVLDRESHKKTGIEAEENAKAYYLKHKIKIKGKIVGEKFVGHYFLYTIKISESNVSHHDLRGYSEDFYLVINSDTARMVDIGVGQINDSIIIDYNAQKKYVWKNEPPNYGTSLPFFTIHYRGRRIKGFGW